MNGIYENLLSKWYNEETKLVQIPGGFFFNWRFKWRRYLITNYNILKMEKSIKYAINHNKTLNLWFHPHNIISAPSTFNVLKRLLYMLTKCVIKVN